MTMRKPNYAMVINELKNEIDTVERFMAPRLKEAYALDEASKHRVLNKTERAHLNELIDYIHEKNCWLIKAKETLKAYYTPVSA